MLGFCLIVFVGCANSNAYERPSVRIVGEAQMTKLPNGNYEVEDVIDGDGFTEDQIPIKLNLIVRDSEIEFDFTGTSPQSESPLKCGKGALFSMVKTIFKSVVDPHAYTNEGWFRALKLTIPDGTVFSATYPSSTSWYFEVSSQGADLVWKAFAPLAKDMTSAGSYVSLTASFIYGKDHRNDDDEKYLCQNMCYRYLR